MLQPNSIALNSRPMEVGAASRMDRPHPVYDTNDRIDASALILWSMTTQPLTIELPEAIFRQFARIAAATQQPIEAIVTESIISNLPPSVEDFQPELQPELLKMQTLSLEELVAISQSVIQLHQHEQHVALLEQHQQRGLTPDEQNTLTNLRQAADNLMLRKAYAWSLLRWRGYPIPTLPELPIPR